MKLGIFYDLSKAFNSVHHCTLVRKLHLYEVVGCDVDLLKLYLCDRIQMVVVYIKRPSVCTIC